MQRIARRASSRIEEKGLAGLVRVEDSVEVPVGEKEAAPQPAVRFMAGESLKALEEGIIYQLGCPFPVDHQLAGLLRDE